MYLGVDGGGTKTAFAVIDDDGRVLAEHEGAGSYYLATGIQAVAGLLNTGVDAVLSKAQLTANEVNYAFFGLPAYGEDSKLIAELDAIPLGSFPRGNYRCDNDMVCGWAGSLACQDGINLVAGTGSIGFGRYQDKTARSGGWGEVFGDEGSAYWVACRGLQLFSKMSDGRARRGPLYDRVRDEYNLAQDLDLSTLVISSWETDRASIAEFSKLMSLAADEGDEQAKAVFHAAADELIEIVESIRTQLAVPVDVELKVSYSGGVFKAGDLVRGPLERGLQASNARYRVCRPKLSPVLGAAYYAAVLDGCDRLRDKLATL